jgi:hypothetical protein
MNFFLPFAEDAEQAERVYQSIVTSVIENMGPVRSQRYYAIYYKHNGRDPCGKGW